MCHAWAGRRMSRRTTRGALASAREDAAKTCVCLCTFLLWINFWSHIASLGACHHPSAPQKQLFAHAGRRRGGCGLVACCCRWTRPASAYLHQCPGAQQFVSSPGPPQSPRPSHWQVAACTRSLCSLGAFGRAATVSCGAWALVRALSWDFGPCRMWAPARCRASGGRGGESPGHTLPPVGTWGSDLLGSWQASTAPAGAFPARVVCRPSLLCSWAERCCSGTWGPPSLSDSCHRPGVSMLSLCRVGTGLCAVWFLDWPCLQILVAWEQRGREGRA